MKIVGLFFVIVAYLLAAIGIIGLLYLDWISGIFLIVAAFLMAAMFAVLLRLVFKSVREKSYWTTIRQIVVMICAIFGFFVTFSIGFVVYNNYISPAKLANVTLRNDQWQKVVFVKMSHIATEKFFEQKKNSLQNLNNENYTFLAEGVGTGTTDSETRINEIMGFDFTNLGYAQIAEVFGFAEQKNTLYEWISPEKIKNVDLTLDEIFSLVWEKNPQQESMAESQNLEESLNLVASLSDHQRNIMREILTSLLNMMIKMTDYQVAQIEQNRDTSPIFHFLYVILNERNKPVVEYISSHPDENIAVVYGALHFPGILQWLQQKDSSWKIISVEPFLPYSQE